MSSPTRFRPRNLGETRLPVRRRGGDAMRDFDSLPAPLRKWVREAALPWSVHSCKRIWQRARQRGESPEMVLARLSRAEARMLEKARQTG